MQIRHPLLILNQALELLADILALNKCSNCRGKFERVHELVDSAAEIMKGKAPGLSKEQENDALSKGMISKSIETDFCALEECLEEVQTKNDSFDKH